MSDQPYDPYDQLKDLQAKFKVPVHLEPCEAGGSYLYYTEPCELIGYVPDGSSEGFYSGCTCSGLTGDPNAVYCKGECWCGACGDHNDDGWLPGLTPEQVEGRQIERVKKAYELLHLDIKGAWEEQNPDKDVVDMLMEKVGMGQALARYIVYAVETDQMPLDELIAEVLAGEGCT